jgi:hypothetical protein
MWGGLLGWKSLAWVPLAGFGGWIVAGYAVRWWLVYPEARPLFISALALLLVAKAGAVAWLVRRLVARRLMSPMMAAVWLLGWVVLAAVVGGLTCRFTGGGAALFALVLLMLPLAAPLAAPLALEAARHR